MAEDDARELTRAVNNLTRVVTNLDELLRRDYPKRAEIERRFTSKQQSRRMFAQGLVLIVIIAALGTYFQVQSNQQETCFENQLATLSGNLADRAALNEKETAQNKALWLIYAEAAGLIKDPGDPELNEDDQSRLNTELVEQLLTYQVEIHKIEKERDQLPTEVYPAGSC